MENRASSTERRGGQRTSPSSGRSWTACGVWNASVFPGNRERLAGGPGDGNECPRSPAGTRRNPARRRGRAPRVARAREKDEKGQTVPLTCRPVKQRSTLWPETVNSSDLEKKFPLRGQLPIWQHRLSTERINRFDRARLNKSWGGVNWFQHLAI